MDGAHRLVAYKRLPLVPVYVTAGIDHETVRAKWLAGFGRHLIFGVPATLAFFLLTLFALRYTTAGSRALDSLRLEVQRREATEAQLRQAQKMDAIGRLTGGVAHDFNNLLTIILGNLERAGRWLTGADPRVGASIERAMEGATRAAKLTQRLLAFSRQQPLEPVSLDVNRLVGGMSEMLRRTLGETIAVETVLAGGLWRTLADPNQMESAILNLAVNARDAMPGGGKLTVETMNAHLDDAYVGQQVDVAAGQYVLIAVADTGEGMSAEVRAKAFDPFFTTKSPDKGTGLGLSQVYGFIRQSGGHVAIYSELGHGTTVKLYLPRHGEAAADDERADHLGAWPAEPVGQGQTILVVEDEPLVRRLSVEVLDDAGYQVLAAESGVRAMELLQAHPDIKLLFTDVILGGTMNGRQLADEMLKLSPDVKVLFTTGYTKNAIVHHGRLDEGVHVIVKPFTTGDLLVKVADLLAE